MTSVFKNPLGTPVGQRLNTAVSHGQSSVDYPIVMEMCDLINDTDNGPKDAKAAFKKILFLNKDAGQVLQSLNILDICIKNGQKRFHRQIITKDFVMELAKLAQSGKSTHTAVREKSLLLIQSWADAYRGKEDMGVAAEIYDQLKSSGVEFPAVNLDDMAPVRTPPSRQPTAAPTQPQHPNLPFSPQTSHPRQSVPQHPYPPQQGAAYPRQQGAAYPPQQRPSGPPRGLSGEQLAKILSEADVVQTNVQVLSDLMLNSVPGQETQENLDFMKNLKDTIQLMQVRVMDLLNSPHTEDITARLLQLNDDINNVFTRYERYERQTQAASNPESSQRTISIPEEPAPGSEISYPFLQSTTPTQPDPPTQLENNFSPPPAPAPAPALPADPIAELMLLDFGTGSTGLGDTPLIPSSLNQTPKPAPEPAPEPYIASDTEPISGLDEFDIFAKSRQSTYASEFDTTSYSDTPQQPSTTLTKALHPRAMSPDDAKGLTEWLAATDLTTSKVDAPGDTQTTSEDFDKFLAERANAPYPGSRKEKKSKDKTPAADEMFSL